MFSVDMLLVTMLVASNGGDAIATCETLSYLFGYFHAMRTCHVNLRYFDWGEQVHLAKGKTEGQQGDLLEKPVFNLTTLHLWGRTLAKYPQDRALAYANDGYIRATMSVTLQVLADLKHVLKVEDGLDLNGSKTSVLSKGVTQTSPLRWVKVGSGFVGIGLPIDSDAFVQKFVATTCRAIIDDVEKLDAIQDGFIHLTMQILLASSGVQLP
jgi:hypothetical protein